MKKRRAGGFTLIEIIIVMVIISVLAGIAAPSFLDYLKSRRLSGATIQLYGDLMNARQQSVTQNRWAWLRIENNHQYKIFTDSNNNKAIDVGDSFITRDLHPDYSDVTFTTAANTSFAFYPNGTGGSATLSLSGASGSKSITISSAGRIKIN